MNYSKMDEKHDNYEVISRRPVVEKRRSQRELWQYMLQVVNFIAVFAIGSFYLAVSNYLISHD